MPPLRQNPICKGGGASSGASAMLQTSSACYAKEQQGEAGDRLGLGYPKTWRHQHFAKLRLQVWRHGLRMATGCGGHAHDGHGKRQNDWENRSNETPRALPRWFR